MTGPTRPEEYPVDPTADLVALLVRLSGITTRLERVVHRLDVKVESRKAETAQ